MCYRVPEDSYELRAGVDHVDFSTRRCVEGYDLREHTQSQCSRINTNTDLSTVDWITQPEALVALLTLTLLEIVLGIDNIIFIC